MNEPSPDEHQIDCREAKEHFRESSLLSWTDERFPGDHLRCPTTTNPGHQPVSHQHANSDHHAETKAQEPPKDDEQDSFHSRERKTTITLLREPRRDQTWPSPILKNLALRSCRGGVPAAGQGILARGNPGAANCNALYVSSSTGAFPVLPASYQTRRQRPRFCNSAPAAAEQGR